VQIFLIILFAVLSAVFYSRGHSVVQPFRSFMRLVYSLCAGWLLAVAATTLLTVDFSLQAIDVAFQLVKYLPVLLLFIGFELHLYGYLAREEE